MFLRNGLKVIALHVKSAFHNGIAFLTQIDIFVKQ